MKVEVLVCAGGSQPTRLPTRQAGGKREGGRCVGRDEQEVSGPPHTTTPPPLNQRHHFSSANNQKPLIVTPAPHAKWGRGGGGAACVCAHSQR